MRVYNVIKYDYRIKKNSVIESYTDIFTAQNQLLCHVFDYIQAQDGINKLEQIDKIIIDKRKFRSSLKKALTPGNYIIKDSEQPYKLEIWKKTTARTKGWIYGEYKNDTWIRVYDYDICELNDKNIMQLNMLTLPIGMLRNERDNEMAKQKGNDIASELRTLDLFEKLNQVDGNIKLSELRKEFKPNFSYTNLSKLSKPVSRKYTFNDFEDNFKGTIKNNYTETDKKEINRVLSMQAAQKARERMSF